MFWERIQELCRREGTTPTALLKQLNLSTSMVTRWREGAEPTPKILIRLARHFNVTTDYLLGLSETQSYDFNMQLIGSKTGLSEKSVEILRVLREDKDQNVMYGIRRRSASQIINLLIEGLIERPDIVDDLTNLSNLDKENYSVLKIFESIINHGTDDEKKLLTAFGGSVPSGEKVFEMRKLALLSKLSSYLEDITFGKKPSNGCENENLFSEVSKFMKLKEKYLDGFYPSEEGSCEDG